MEQQIWKLWVSADKYLSLIPHDLEYFSHRFHGEPIERPWQTPPVKISGKSKKLADFVSWMVCVPVISQRARDVLEPIVANHVEFLPFCELRKGKNYYAMNVLTVENVLDKERSEITYYDAAAGDILSISRFVLETKGRVMPPIFKVEPERANIFVTSVFADAVIANKLSGVGFLDPAADVFESIINRRPLNMLPGAIV